MSASANTLIKTITSSTSKADFAEEVKGLISSGVVKVSMENGAPNISVDPSQVSGLAKDLVDGLKNLSSAVVKAQKSIPNLANDVKSLIASAQSVVSSAPSELQGAVASGALKPLDVPKKLKVVKKNVAELKTITAHLNELKKQTTDSIKLLNDMISK